MNIAISGTVDEIIALGQLLEAGRDAMRVEVVTDGTVTLTTTQFAVVSTIACTDGKIAAIARVREMTGCGLQEAKDFVDAKCM